MKTTTSKHCIAFGAAVASLLASSASAHIVFATPEAAVNSYYAGFLQVGHGCGASPTRSIRVAIPEGINIARPQPKPGWTVHVETEALAESVSVEGGTMTERVSAITWTGELPADQFDLFGIMMRLPQAGSLLYFPTVQSCAEGENAWIEIPAAGAAWTSVPHPAPVLTLSGGQPAPAEGGEHEHHH